MIWLEWFMRGLVVLSVLTAVGMIANLVRLTRKIGDQHGRE